MKAGSIGDSGEWQRTAEALGSHSKLWLSYLCGALEVGVRNRKELKITLRAVA